MGEEEKENNILAFGNRFEGMRRNFLKILGFL